ncbi:DUF2938 domain-containing protein [Candidimonas humi]|jgi:hypothetical protein|uniref:DUF2938 domain-containing protein n=1 Tax=Candidimonas humi TaxID=683355 RepID=A0ABV8P0G7_9BURK|nr:DUF2938 domain-containing protein [Candidimonas humi]MBV6305332.1 DUF2938 domain-containing protein [Candidimonas humi]
MMTMDEMARAVLIGIGATLVMDLWTVLLKALSAPTLNYALVGRWAGHLLRGQLAHASIGKAAPVRGELPLGWAIHYGVGIAFAALLVLVCGTGWVRDPTWEAALVLGMATVVFPLFVMQPAMGAGIAGSRTPTPLKNCLRSLATHAVFGCGLYLSANVLKRVWT